MHILIDACLPVQFKDHLPWNNVKTTRELQWHTFKNGDLLKVAEKNFDVFVTMDKNIPNQQYLSNFNIAVIILRAKTNRLEDLLPMIPEISKQLTEAKQGTAIIIE